MSEELNRYIVADPSVMGGKPVIRGTRISVESILEKIAAGESVDPDDKATVVASVIAAHESEMIDGFSVIGPSTVRIRSAPARTTVRTYRTRVPRRISGMGVRGEAV